MDSAAAEPQLATWSASGDWRERAVAARARIGHHADPAAFLADRDGRVVAVALDALAAGPGRPAAPVVAAARSLLVHADAAVRSVAAAILERAPDVADIAALRTAVAASARDSFPDAAEAALGGLAAIARTSDAARVQVDREALDRLPRPADYLIRRWAESNWPAAARRWGPPTRSPPGAPSRTIGTWLADTSSVPTPRPTRMS